VASDKHYNVNFVNGKTAALMLKDNKRKFILVDDTRRGDETEPVKVSYSKILEGIVSAANSVVNMESQDVTAVSQNDLMNGFYDMDSGQLDEIWQHVLYGVKLFKH
jgi:hypothetical protein